MQRMTDALSRMLNDPSTRLAMRSMQESRESRRQQQQQRQQEVAGSSSSDVPSEGTGEQARLETEGNGAARSAEAEVEVEEGETGPTAAGSTTVRRRLSSAGNDILEEDGGGGGVDAWPGEGRRTSDGNAERRISDIQESISSMREEYVERYNGIISVLL